MRNEFSDEIIKVDKFGREFLSTTIGGGGGGGGYCHICNSSRVRGRFLYKAPLFLELLANLLYNLLKYIGDSL